MVDASQLTQQRRGELAVSERRSCSGGSNAGVPGEGRQRSKVTEVGVDVVRPGVVELWLGGVHQDRHQSLEASEGEVENKGKLEAHQQGQCARGVQRAAAARHSQGRSDGYSGSSPWRGQRMERRAEQAVNGSRVAAGGVEQEAEGEGGERAALIPGSGVHQEGFHLQEWGTVVVKLSEDRHHLLNTNVADREAGEEEEGNTIRSTLFTLCVFKVHVKLCAFFLTPDP